MSYEKMADTIVNKCLKVNKKDIVIVSTYQHTLDLAEEIAMQCFDREADVLMTLDTDQVFYHHLHVLPESNLKRTSAHCLGLSEYSTVNIFIGGPEDPKPMGDVPPGKYAALFEGEQPHGDYMREKKIRIGYLGIGAVTSQRAKTYGFDYERWKRMVTAASAVDPSEMLKFGNKLAGRLDKGKHMRVTTKAGTDLSFDLGNRKAFVFTPTLTKANMERGLFGVSIPAGDVTIAPVEKSVEGKAFFDVPQPSVGKLVEGMRWTFKDGRVKSFTAKRNVNALKGIWEKGHGDKDRLGMISFGINPKGRLGFLENYLAMGAVTLSLGDNDELGGENRSDTGAQASMSRATVEVDDKVILKNGEYTI
ncbi:MAG: aminopeptidase [Thermoplasmata archaeon]